MNTYNSRWGTGRIRCGGLPIGKVEFELMVNRYGDGERLAFGTVHVADNILRRVNEAYGAFVLELENKSGMVELALGETGQNLIHFDAIGNIPDL